VFVDIDPVTFNLDVALAEKAITPKTKAIIPVHIFGQGVDMDPVMALARAHGLKVLEDVAQAFSGEYKGTKLGNIGDIGAYSFFPSKNLGCYGDGGLITTNDDQLAATCKMLRVHGAKKKYYNEVVGYNSRLDTIQAAVLRVKLPHIEAASAGRRQAADTYRELLAGIPGVTAPQETIPGRHVYHQYTVRIAGDKRDAVQQALDAAGVGTMVYYPVPVHQLPLYQHLGVKLPLAEQAASEVLSLPIWPTIDRATQERVVNALNAAL
jgi:dTDP-4-amino-4,6-dideoxygalactose transaminase